MHVHVSGTFFGLHVHVSEGEGNTFYFEMCFVPQRRALFEHLNVQKCSELGVLCRFWLRNVLRATTPSTFRTSELPKVLRDSGALYILSSKRASHQSAVHFFDIF